MAPQFLRWSLGTAALILAIVALLNGWVDPYMQYRMPAYQPRYSANDARSINAGLARNANYDTVIVGSSFSMNFRNSEFEQEFGGRAITLALPGMFFSEAERVLKYAIHKRNVRRVFLGIDFFAFNEQDNKYHFPDYLYDDTALNDGPYLLNPGVAKRSVNILLGRGIGSFNTDPDSPWRWYREEAQFSRANALGDFNAMRKAVISPGGPGGARVDVGARIEALVRPYPQVEFHLFLAPYSALSWVLEAERNTVGSTLELRSRLAQAAARQPNTRLHDFQAMDAICNLDLYSDIGHYSPRVNSMMVVGMRSGQFVATPEAVAANNAKLQRIIAGKCDGRIAIGP